MTGDRPRRVSRDDLGSGAISGLWLPDGAPPVELVRADQIRSGDALFYDGRILTVTGATGATYVDDGERVSGLAIVTAAGSARWTLYRRGADLLARVLPS